MRHTFYIATLCVIFVLPASASEKGRIGFVGVRYLGMGGARVGLANGGDSILENPTGLSQVPEWRATMPLVPLTMTPNMTLLINDDVLGMIDAALDIEDADNIFDRIERIEEAVADYPYASVEGGIFPSFVMHNFGVGLLASGVFGVSTGAVISGTPEVYESLNLAYRGYFDAGGFLSHTRDLPWQPTLFEEKGDLFAGATLKAVWRGYMKSIEEVGLEEGDEEKYDKCVEDQSETDDVDEDLSWDGGLSVDLAARLELNDDRSTSLSLVLYNLPSGIEYSYEDGTRMRVRVSAAMGLASRPFATITRLSHLLVGLDIREIGQGGALHLGAEYPVGPAGIRMGLSGDGFAWGLGMKWRTVELDYAHHKTSNAWFGDDYVIWNHVIRMNLDL